MNEDLRELLSLILESKNPNKAVEVAYSIFARLTQDGLLPTQTADVP